MKSLEFKSRQMWLEFECAASDALRVVAESIESFRKWFKEWKPKKQIKFKINNSLMLWNENENLHVKKI